MLEGGGYGGICISSPRHWSQQVLFRLKIHEDWKREIRGQLINVFNTTVKVAEFIALISSSDSIKFLAIEGLTSSTKVDQYALTQWLR